VLDLPDDEGLGDRFARAAQSLNPARRMISVVEPVQPGPVRLIHDGEPTGSQKPLACPVSGVLGQR